MNDPICIYHKGCADGFAAAMVVRRALGAGVEFIPAAYGEAPPDVTGRDVIMVDFSYKRPVIDAMAGVARTILILDHHKTAAEDLKGITFPFVMSGWDEHLESVHNAYHVLDRDPRAPFAIFDMDRSGAQIAWDFFMPFAAKRPKLIEYVADRDLWRFELPYSREISAWLFSHPQDFGTWAALTEELEIGWGWDRAVATGEAIERKHHRDVASVVGNTRREMLIGGISVPVANVPHFMASDAGNLMAEGHPFSASYYDRPDARVFSLRSREGGADVAEIAAQYGGGGHKHAAGFQAAPGWEGDEAKHG
jgi:oligoribonuclease NrnB/cAMP/cGMP phosphodiesterase (DHH superfamily)